MSQTTGIDLADLNGNSSDTAELSILHPATGVETGAKITVFSADSDTWRKQSMKLQSENLKLRRRGQVSAEKIDEDSLRLLAAVTVSWSGIKENGQELPCNFENALNLYREYPFIREQVDEFAGERRNFFNV